MSLHSFTAVMKGMPEGLTEREQELWWYRKDEQQRCDMACLRSERDELAAEIKRLTNLLAAIASQEGTNVQWAKAVIEAAEAAEREEG